MFIDWIGILLIVVPIFSPMLLNLGFEPLWVGVVICTSLQISFLTPPFAYSIFLSQGVGPWPRTDGNVQRDYPFCVSADARGHFVDHFSTTLPVASQGAR
ncbi:conserved hypothetical protein [delta proteobacterium NaphS2]|nr:conserved hypothetical protein [delta proteobacterium NaphS2]